MTKKEDYMKSIGEVRTACIDVINNSEIKLGLRGLHYKLVGSTVFNNKKEYDRLGRILRDLRYDGILPYDCIDDSERVTILPSFYDDMKELIETALVNYKIDCWEDQDNYVEILTEKKGLVSLSKMSYSVLSIL